VDNKIFYSNSLSDTFNIALIFLKWLKVGDIVVLEGDLGVGKTEFVRVICNELGVDDVITSPTFTLINQYESEFASIYHIDLYRIKSCEELLYMGFQEFFDNMNSIFFIEWGVNSFGLLPRIDYKILFKHNDSETSRVIEIVKYV
jgi:tRNA threonylcarbamoyladenosine biosynthesis protein TsaE